VIGINEATDADDFARLKLRDRGTDFGHPTDDFVTGHDGIHGGDGAPFIAHLMRVGVQTFAPTLV